MKIFNSFFLRKKRRKSKRTWIKLKRLKTSYWLYTSIEIVFIYTLKIDIRPNVDVLPNKRVNKKNLLTKFNEFAVLITLWQFYSLVFFHFHIEHGNIIIRVHTAHSNTSNRCNQLQNKHIELQQINPNKKEAFNEPFMERFHQPVRMKALLNGSCLCFISILCRQ